MAKKLTKEEIEKLYELYLTGMSCENIGKQTGHSIDTVTKYLKKDYGIIPRIKIDVDKLRELVLEGKTTKECAEYFNVDPSAISYWKKKINDKDVYVHVNFSQEEHQFTHLQKQMILGSLLGDLSIGKIRNTNTRLYLVHSVKQRELFMKKVEILGEWMAAYKQYDTFDKRTNKVYSTLRGATWAHPEITQLRHLLYPNGIKTITKEYLDLIDHPIALAYWFMDDGCYSGILATNGFTETEVDLLKKWLNDKWSIQAEKRCAKNQFILKITKESRRNFELLIDPYIIPSMKYKLKYIFESLSV